MQLQGCFTALITPFTESGEIDYGQLKYLVQQQMEGGVSGIVPVGTSGESPTLSFEEHFKVVETVISTVAGKCKVIAGTGANSTSEAVELTKHARKAGADATLQVTPYYNKPTQEGLYRHFSTVAEEGGLPVVLYQVPGRTGRSIDVDTIERLASQSGVVAVKEACPDIDRTSEILNRCSRIDVLSGDDSMTLPRMIVGGSGVISVASNLIPGRISEMTSSALEGDWENARKLHSQLFPLFRDLFITTNPIPVKSAMAMAGLINEKYRLPLCEMEAGQRHILKQSVINAGLELAE